MSGLRARWAQLSLREQRALGIGGGALAVLLAWLMGLEPLAARVDAAARQLAAERATAVWLQALPMSAAAPPRQPPATGETALGLLNQDLREAGLDAALKRLTPAGDGRFDLGLEGADWQALARWLAEAWRDRGLKVERAQLEKTPTPGRVNAQLTVAFPGSEERTP